MSLVMDRRIAQRRRLVLEEHARIRLRWIISFFWIVTTAGLLLALVRSPWLDIDEVRVSGAHNADVSAALAAADVAVGVPTLSVDTAAVAAALQEDPWVARFDVTVVWPNIVEITVLEHQSIAWVETRNGWIRVSAAGTVISRGDTVPDAAARVRLDEDVAGKVGEEVSSRTALAAVEFLANLPSDLRRKARVWGDADRIGANVAGHRVELGTASEMPEKAAVVAGLLEAEDLTTDSVLNVVAPSRPAIRNSQPQVEGSTTGRSGISTSG